LNDYDPQTGNFTDYSDGDEVLIHDHIDTIQYHTSESEPPVTYVFLESRGTSDFEYDRLTFWGDITDDFQEDDEISLEVTIDINEDNEEYWRYTNDDLENLQPEEELEERKADIPKLFGIFDIPLPDALNNTFGVFIVSIVFWALLALLIAGIMNPVIRSLAKKTETRVDDIILNIVTKPIFFLILLYGTVSSLNVLGLPDFIMNALWIIYRVGFVFIIGYVVYAIFKDVLIYYGREASRKTDTDLDEHVFIPLMEKLGKIVIFIFLLIYLMSYLGINSSSLLLGGTVFGLVIAFAAQDTLSNLFSGIHLIIDQPFKVGDLIILEDGTYCRVDVIGLRSTKLYNLFEHEVIIEPNSNIAGQRIINATKPDIKFKVKVTVGVAYGTDIKKVQDILKGILMKHPEVLKEKGLMPFIRFTNFGDSSLDFKTFCWIDNVENQWRVAHEIRQEIDRRFTEEGIEIPFPQRVVWNAEQEKAEKVNDS